MLNADWYCFMCIEMWKLATGLTKHVFLDRDGRKIKPGLSKFLENEIVAAEYWLRTLTNEYHYRCGDWGKPKESRYFCHALYLSATMKFGIDFNEFSQTLDWREVQADYRRMKDGQP